jgi:hypothetical protein
VQGGHVRVDLVYSAVKHRTKRVIDMFGCLFFMMPAIVITYLYAWFFMWRHLMTPAVTSTSDLDRMLMQARIFRWNVETIGFSPNGFNAYFLFKVLIVLFCVAGLPAGGRLLLAVLPRMGRGRGQRGQVPGPRRIGDEAEELEHAIHSGST